MNKDKAYMAIEAAKFAINELYRKGSISYCKKTPRGVLMIDYAEAIEILNELQKTHC